MKYIIKYCLSLIFLLLTILSCDNALDQRPVDSFNEESLFEDINLIEAFLYNCYDEMGGGEPQVLGMREDLLSSSTDELLNIHRAGETTFTKGTLTPDYLGHFGNWRYGWILWDFNYANIKNVNTLLGGIDNVPISSVSDEDKISQIKAEAHFIRAFNYTNLLRSYGGVVLVDKKFSLTDDFSQWERASIDETVEFILKDIDKALEGLPVINEVMGRATKGAAAALKSRLLSFSSGELSNGGFEPTNEFVSFQGGDRTQRLTAAKNIAKDIIDGKYGDYGLVGTTDDPPVNMTEEEVMAYADNYSSIFLQKGSLNKEVLFGVLYKARQGNYIRTNLHWGPNGYNCWGNNEPTEPVVRQFEMKDGTPFIWDKYNPGEQNIREFTQAQIQADPELNPFVGREPRFYANVLFDKAPWRDRPSTNNEIQIGSRVNAPGAGLLGKGTVSEKIAKVTNLASVTIGGDDSRQARNQAWNGTKTGYYLRKMVDITLDGEINDNENAWIEFRYAEVLLDYAEACIELGEIEEGLIAINEIRNRAGLPDRPTTVNQNQAREWYRHERLIEMLAEGDRWYMIRKWMICDDVIKDFHPMYIYHFNDGSSMYIYNTTTLADARSWEDKNYWLPISRTERNKAPQLKQNPKY